MPTMGNEAGRGPLPGPLARLIAVGRLAGLVFRFFVTLAFTQDIHHLAVST